MPGKAGMGITVCVIMQNPSWVRRETADRSARFRADMVFGRKLPEFEGVDRLFVADLFVRGQIKDFKGKAHAIGSRKEVAIEAALRTSEIVIIGWGISNNFSERKSWCKQLFKIQMRPSRRRHDGFIGVGMGGMLAEENGSRTHLRPSHGFIRF